MAILISAFPIESKSGGGWVSQRIMKLKHFSSILWRQESFWVKSWWAFVGILFFPFLHPIFSRFVPIIFKRKKTYEELWLNFSQTFALSLLHRDCVLICHDLHCHCDHRFVRWVRWSERLLLHKAKRVIVLSNRDKKIINRFYGVPSNKIENIGPALMPELHAFQKNMFSPPRKVAFLGSMKRIENRDGLQWFVKHVLPECPQLEISIIGEASPDSIIEHSQLKYLGYVDDIDAIILEQDLMIAPLFSQAGIKIKVIESLLLKIPVLGSINAYSGLPRPKGKWCSNNPEDWIAILNDGDNFGFNGI